jgi:hypothetical protein
MGPRIWAAIANILRVSAAVSCLAAFGFGTRAIEYNQRGAPDSLVMETAVLAVGSFAVALLLWNLKGPLVRGNLVVRLLVGLYMLLWVIGTLGLGLIFILIAYLVTGEPDHYDTVGKGKPPKPRFKAPANWSPTARVGPSGAMLYADANRVAASGIFDSFTPVQVVDRQGGFAHVVAATGEGGWIDLRTLTEVV